MVLPPQGASPSPGSRYSDLFCQVYVRTGAVWDAAAGQWGSTLYLVRIPSWLLVQSVIISEFSGIYTVEYNLFHSVEAKLDQ
jgi:hypothetical protein